MSIFKSDKDFFIFPLLSFVLCVLVFYIKYLAKDIYFLVSSICTQYSETVYSCQPARGGFILIDYLRLMVVLGSNGHYWISISGEVFLRKA